jgi:hypothetical protein
MRCLERTFVREVYHDPQHDLTAAISGRTPKPHGRLGRGGVPIHTAALGPTIQRCAHTKGDAADDRPYREHRGGATLR